MVRNETALRLMDGALPVLGLGLLLIGATAEPLALPLASTALGLAFIGWVAEADGFALPRQHGAWSGGYTVRERPRGRGTDARFELPVAPTGGWALCGQTPVSELRFEHHERVSYVTRRSLEQALAGVRS
jgi:hypothetical protein